MVKRLAHQLAEEADAEEGKRKTEKMEAEINALKAKYPDLAEKASNAKNRAEALGILGEMYELEKQEKEQGFDKDLSLVLALLSPNTEDPQLPPLSTKRLNQIQKAVKERKGARAFEQWEMTASQAESAIEKSNQRIFDILTPENKEKYLIIKQQLESKATAYTYKNYETLDHKIIGALLNVLLTEEIK